MEYLTSQAQREGAFFTISIEGTKENPYYYSKVVNPVNISFHQEDIVL